MVHRLGFALISIAGAAALLLARSLANAPAPPPQADPVSLEQGFREPPMSARPYIYYMVLNGYVERAHVEKELAGYAEAGIGGICVFDIGARGDPAGAPPAGPAFLSPESAADLAHIIRTAGRHGMEVDLSVASSWDMGGEWVEPADASMTLVQSALAIEGGRDVDVLLPFPAVPPDTPRLSNGQPAFAKDIALLAIRNPERLPGYEFVFRLRPPLPQTIDRVVLYNTNSAFAKDFVVAVSGTHPGAAAFHDIVRGTLQPREGPQEFRITPVNAKYTRLQILNGYDPQPGAVQLGEFEVYSTQGENVNLNHEAVRVSDSAELLSYTSARGQLGTWTASNIHDAVKSGPGGSWAAGDTGALLIRDRKSVVDLTARLNPAGRLRWRAPAGKWLLLRYVCVNTGERLKVPSPKSDGLATDHFSAAATKRYLNEVLRRLGPAVGDFRKSALRDLYLASYEVRGRIWTPDFLNQFRKRRGYDFTPFLPVLNSGRVDDEQTTERVLFDFRKTQGELLVDAYYRASAEAAHDAGLNIESEAGGPGPPIHQVPVDALQALGAMDSVRGEFWPGRPNLGAIWVVKETASAAHIYGKKRVHMEAFTSNNHWQEGPQDLKLAADRAFAEGMNHVVWHTAAHQPPSAGKPGWVYGAGTHLNQNVTWWPMAKPFLSYLARTSFLLQQGVPVSDVLYYYGDQGYNFVPPKQMEPGLGFGYDYDVTNAEVLTHRLDVRGGKLVLPEGISYEVLSLPDREDIDIGVLRRVESLVRRGATVAGPRPARSSGYAGFPQRDRDVRALAAKIWGACDGTRVTQVGYGKGQVVCGKPLREILNSRGAGPDFQFTSSNDNSDLDFVHRRTTDADIYFVQNKNRRWARIDAEFRVRGRQPELWDAATGQRREQTEFVATTQGTRFPLQLEPEGSIFIVFRRAGTPPSQPVKTAAQPRVEQVEIRGPWRVRFTDGPAAPEAAVWNDLRSWTASPDPRTRYFSGIAEYENEITVPDAWAAQRRRVYVNLGELWAVAEVQLNSRDLGVVWKRPFRVDITAAMRPGSNNLKVRVANNWVNRLVGDALAPESARNTKTNILTTGAAGARWRDVPLHESGLMGPVRLESEVRASAAQ